MDKCLDRRDVPSGTEVTAEAPLEHIPLFLRDGAQLPITQN